LTVSQAVPHQVQITLQQPCVDDGEPNCSVASRQFNPVKVAENREGRLERPPFFVFDLLSVYGKLLPGPGFGPLFGPGPGPGP
jgi:hypothetical protein